MYLSSPARTLAQRRSVETASLPRVSLSRTMRRINRLSVVGIRFMSSIMMEVKAEMYIRYL